MIKGVNKRILEVPLNDSEYFERAVLFLRADAPDISPSLLTDEAKKTVPEIQVKRPCPLLFFIVMKLLPRAALVICAVCGILILKG